jgi:hypothetical protein
MSIVDLSINLGAIAASVASASIVSFVIGYLKLRERVIKIEESVCKEPGWISDVNKRIDKLETEQRSISEKLVSYCTKMDLMWEGVKNNMIDMLHHPNSPERDALLEKWKAGIISLDELKNLKQILEHTMINQKGSVDAIVAANLAVLADQQLKEWFKGKIC